MSGRKTIAFCLAVLTSVVLASGCSRKRPPKPKPKPPAPKVKVNKFKEMGYGPGNTGGIMFVCNDPSHGEKEVVLHACPNCGKRDWFLAYQNEWYCYKCQKKVPKEYIKCNECGKPPKSTHLKR